MQSLSSMVQHLRGAPTTKNTIDFQMWAMTIDGIWLFLHAEELSLVEVKDFKIDFFTVWPGSVHKIAVKVQGKTDAKPVLLSLFRDDHCPEFCPICAIFTQIWATGIMSGPLFPKTEFLNLHVEKMGGTTHSAVPMNSSKVLPHSCSS